MGTIQLQQQEMMRLHHGINNGSGRQSGMRSCHSPLVGTATSSSGTAGSSSGGPLFLGGGGAGNWSHVYRPPPCGRWVWKDQITHTCRFLYSFRDRCFITDRVTTATVIRITTKLPLWWCHHLRRPNLNTPTPPCTVSVIMKIYARLLFLIAVLFAILTTCEITDSRESKWFNIQCN